MCSEFRNTLFWLFLFFCFFLFLPVSTRSANLQMQSIALVLSQIDFSSALGHLGRPSLAFTGSPRRPFGTILQRPFCVISSLRVIVFAKSLTLRVFLSLLTAQQEVLSTGFSLQLKLSIRFSVGGATGFPGR